MKAQMKKTVLWIAVVLFLFFGVAFVAIRGGYMPTPLFLMKQPALPPIPASTRDGRWGQTVKYLGSQLSYLHVNPYFKISEADFQQGVRKLAEDVPDLNDEQITVEMMRIVASIGDGHTRIYSRAESAFFARLPIELRWLSDGLFVIAASPEYEQTVGAKVIQIGAHPVGNVYEAVIPLIPADNEMVLLNDSPAIMSMPSILYGLDLIPQKGQVIFSFEGQDGSLFDLELQSRSGNPEPFISVYEKAGVQVPLYEQDRDTFYWLRDLPEANAVYVQYNVCGGQKRKPFKSFVEEVFSLVDRNQESRLIMDLRFNGGGNEAILTPFIEAIEARPKFDEPGKLFVIIGRGTYSSALQNAITLSRENNATLVGEPTGGKPNHYGEVRSFKLPNSDLRVQYSTRYWLNYPGSDPLTLEPDIPAMLTIGDLLVGRDPALEAALQP